MESGVSANAYEDELIDRITLREIVATLTPRERRVARSSPSSTCKAYSLPTANILRMVLCIWLSSAGGADTTKGLVRVPSLV